ncbi:MAG: hypothetical protein EBW06_11415 [Gammaproteobacteria bacterium]|nr:hypothetical protein [Gammaproteobacteria bacterium]
MAKLCYPCGNLATNMMYFNAPHQSDLCEVEDTHRHASIGWAELGTFESILRLQVRCPSQTFGI